MELFYALSLQVLREVRASAGTCKVCRCQLVQPEVVLLKPLVLLHAVCLGGLASLLLLTSTGRERSLPLSGGLVPAICPSADEQQNLVAVNGHQVTRVSRYLAPCQILVPMPWI